MLDFTIKIKFLSWFSCNIYIILNWKYCIVTIAKINIISIYDKYELFDRSNLDGTFISSRITAIFISNTIIVLFFIGTTHSLSTIFRWNLLLNLLFPSITADIPNRLFLHIHMQWLNLFFQSYVSNILLHVFPKKWLNAIKLLHICSDTLYFSYVI